MALFTKISTVGPATIVKTFDDLTMKLISFSYNNPGEIKLVHIEFISPYKRSITATPKTGVVEISIPSGQQPSFTLGPRGEIQGIDYVVSYGV